MTTPTDALPPLPEPFEVWTEDEPNALITGYTSDQMRAYARAALSAQPAAQGSDSLDAKRYRWLRDTATDKWVQWADERDNGEALPIEIDASIDSAMLAASPLPPETQG